MIRFFMLLIGLSMMLFFYREFSHQSLNQKAAERRVEAARAGLERQRAVPLRPRDPAARQRQR